jgi:hypothetical protein
MGYSVYASIDLISEQAQLAIDELENAFEGEIISSDQYDCHVVYYIEARNLEMERVVEVATHVTKLVDGTAEISYQAENDDEKVLIWVGKNAEIMEANHRVSEITGHLEWLTQHPEQTLIALNGGPTKELIEKLVGLYAG